MLKSKPKNEDAVLAEIRVLRKEVASLRGERDAQKDKKKLDEEIIQLKKEITDLTIARDVEKEKHDREQRETTHMVGLQRKRAEFENDAAKREAVLSVREENLQADKKRFEEHVSFIEERFDQQFEAMNDIMSKILERMPTTKQLINVGSSHNGNGSEDD